MRENQETVFHYEDNEDVVRVFQPDILEKQLLRPETGPVEQVKNFLQSFGIPQDKITLYQEAVHAFLNRGSIVEKEGLQRFTPAPKYFQPKIGFQDVVTKGDFRSRDQKRFLFDTFPDFLRRLDLKPHLGQKEGVDTVEVSGEEILAELERDGTPYEPGVSPKSDTPTKGEKMLVQLNRLMYALHEPIHIQEGLNIGDRLSLLKNRLSAEGIFDPQKEKEIVAVLPDIQEDEVTVEMHPGLDLHNSEKLKELGVEKVWSLIPENEMTMDMISARFTKDLIKENPAFLMYVHNTFIGFVEAARAYRGRGKKDEKLEKKLEAGLRAFGQTYFAAVKDSEEMRLIFDKPQKALGKNVGGKLAEVPKFTEYDWLNLMEEISYPESAHPIQEGVVENFIQMVDAGLESGQTFDQIVQAIKNAPEDSSPQGAPLKELVEWLHPSIGSKDYNKGLLLRKKIFPILEKRRPDLAQTIIQFPFYELKPTHNSVEEKMVLGFSDNWDEIAASESLGIIALNMKELPADKKASVQLAWNSYKAGTMPYESALKILVEMKRDI